MFMTNTRYKPKQYICCFCIHVRTATVAIGIFNLAILCGALMSHPQGYLPPGASSYSNGGGAGGGGVNDSRMAVNVNGAAHLNNDKFSGLLFIIAMFTINLMLLIGAVQYRQTYLMPFFCVQVLEFSISCISGISFLFYTPDIKLWIINESNIPQTSRQQIMEMKEETLKLIVLISIFGGLIIKAYLIDVVASCYKYFVYKNEQLSNLVDILESSADAVTAAAAIADITSNTISGAVVVPTAVQPASSAINNHQIDTSKMLLPPKYEDVFSVVIPTDDDTESAPPSYSDASVLTVTTFVTEPVYHRST